MTADIVSQLTQSPGVYDDIPENVYHADTRALSCSGAKKLLPPSCPARFRHEQLHGQPHKATFDFGHAAHTAVLGVGAPVVIIDADDWRGKAAREARDAAYAAGHVPLLAKEAAQVAAMRTALREHPVARTVFDPDRGKPEQSLYRVDPASGVPLRARLDWLPDAVDGRMVIADYKTTVSAEPGAIARSVASFGYHQQAAWYADMALGLGLAEVVGFVFVFQEKTAPHLVTVAEVDDEALRIGRHLNRQAIDLYAECVAADRWPGYSDDDVALISLPRWAAAPYDYEELSA